MLQPHQRFGPLTALLLAGIVLIGSCGHTTNDDPGDRPPDDASEATAGEAGRSGMVGDAEPTTGPILSLGGTSGQPPDPPKPTRGVGTCHAADLPGQPCQDGTCWSARCGVRFQLACQAGTWIVDGSALAFDMVCQPEDEFTSAITDITTGACCSDWRPRNNPAEPPSCELCPAETPRDGEACSLPSDCSVPILDCFYDCCCYGTMAWAQCDGQHWRVATDCSGK